MKRLAASTHFQRQLRKLPAQTQRKTVETLKGFLLALQTGSIPMGYGFKKINGDKYELRVDLGTRVIMKAEGDTLICHLVGDHEDVRRYLRAYRNK